MVAAFQRRLRPGTEYNRYFDLSGLERTDPVVVKDGDTFDTIDLMAKLARQYQADTASVAPQLRGKTLEATCRNIWEFAYRHFQYTPDKAGVEQLRRPLRAWADRTAGIDCDCYSLLVSTILLNLGIAHRLRKTKYENRGDYQHIYVVVPIPGTSRYYTIDPVTDRFDHEVPFTAKHDLAMPVQVLNGLPIQVLNGLGNATGAPLVPTGSYAAFGFGAEFLGLASETEAARQQALQSIRELSLKGLAAAAATDVLPSPEQVAALAAATGQTHEEATADALAVAHASASFVERCRQLLANMLEQLDRDPKPDAHFAKLRGWLRQLLAAWDNEPERTRLFTALGAEEERSVTTAGLNGLGNWITDAWDSVSSAASSAWNGITSAASSVGNAVSQAASWTYGTIIKPVGQAIGQAAGWVANTVVTGVKAAAEGIKNAAKWVGNEFVELGKLILKYNPLSIVIRAGMRVAFRVNLFYMSSRLGNGYYSEAEARAAGLDLGEWNNCKSTLGKVISLWDGLQGDQDVLRESILLGYSSSDHFHIAAAPALNGPARGLGDGGTTAAATAAATPFIVKVVEWLKSIDWSKLIQAAASLTQKLAAQKAQASVPPMNDNTQLMVPTSEADYAANKVRYDTQTTPGSDSSLPVLLGAGLLGVYLVMQQKSPAS